MWHIQTCQPTVAASDISDKGIKKNMYFKLQARMLDTPVLKHTVVERAICAMHESWYVTVRLHI